MNPKFRWLLHSAVEQNFPELFTFSVGEQNLEQVVVCRIEAILRKICSGECTHEKALSWVEKKYGSRKPEQVTIGKEPATKRSWMKTCQEAQQEVPQCPNMEALRSAAQNESRKASRRPDIQIYVPRARRNAPPPPNQCPADGAVTSLTNVSVRAPTKQAVPKRSTNTGTKTLKKETCVASDEGRNLTSDVKTDAQKSEKILNEKTGREISFCSVKETAFNSGLNLEKNVPSLHGEVISNREELSVPTDNTEILPVFSQTSGVDVTRPEAANVFSNSSSLNTDGISNPVSRLEKTVESCVISKETIREVEPPKTNLKTVNNSDIKDYQEDTGSPSNVPELSAEKCVSLNNNRQRLSETNNFIKVQCSSSSSSSTTSTVLRDCSVKRTGNAERKPSEGCMAGKPSSHLENADGGSDSWDALFDENGDRLHPSVMAGLKSALGKTEIQKPKIDYLDFQPLEPDLSDECYDHILELYDFPTEFKTQNLMMAFSAFKDRGFDIKWVDDTHALAIFSSPVAASEALELQIPFIKTRPMSQAISKSKSKVYKKQDYLLPSRPRPETSAALARRMITGALGVRSSVTREQRDLERQKLQAAKEVKRQVAKQRQDIWNGTVS